MGTKPPTNDGWDNDDFGISWESRESNNHDTSQPAGIYGLLMCRFATV